MSEKWNEDNIQEAEKSEETRNGDWPLPEGSGVILGEDWPLPEGSGVILGEDWQEPEEAKGSREEISEELVDLVIGGMAKTDRKSRSRRKRKKDDILLQCDGAHGAAYSRIRLYMVQSLR